MFKLRESFRRSIPSQLINFWLLDNISLLHLIAAEPEHRAIRDASGFLCVFQ